MKRTLGRASGSIGQRLLAFARQCSDDGLPGSICVSNKIITDIRPLGGVNKPGVTKVGRLSLAGTCEGRRVKVYSGHSARQNELRRNIQSIELGGCEFPDLIAVDNDFVVEAWIDGVQVSELRNAEALQAKLAVEVFFNTARTSSDMSSLVAMHGEAFCYFSDYLLPRLNVWRRWNLIEEFLAVWHARYEQLRDKLPVHFTHPDLSAANIILERSTGRYVIIDNELIGVGHGWLLDGRNSFLSSDLSVNVPDDFVELSWRLRQIGSALDAGNMALVSKLCKKLAIGLE